MNENKEILENDITELLDLSNILSQPQIQSIIQELEFYFQKGQDALKKWMEQSVSEELKNKLISLSKNYNKIQEEATKHDDIKEVLDLFFEITAYCDNHAKDKFIFNKYEDKRALADAGVRMNSWVEKLIQYKFSPSEVGAGSTQNAFNYLLDPEHNSTILSENHRKLISENLVKKTYKPNEFVTNLNLFFDAYNLHTINPKNYTHLLMWIVYSLQDIWKEGVIGLMASDGTGWQVDFMQRMNDYDAAIIWNSKRPSGTNETIKILKEIIQEKNEFPIYYNIRGKVIYKATIIDFAENQDELNKKGWDKKFKILDYESNFENYKDDNKKATIVFLAKSLEKIDPIPTANFEFYKGYRVPTQDNLTPIKTVNQSGELSSFKKIIEQVKVKLEEDIATKSLFVFENTRSYFVWIKDRNDIIGSTIAHYELISRSEEIFLEVHFEGKQQDKDYFHEVIKTLPENIGWFDWNKSKSIRYNGGFSMNDPAVAEKIINGLIYLENNLGAQLRNAIKTMKKPTNEHLNQILFGPPGTGKTFNTVNKAIAIAHPDFNLNQSRDNIKQEFDRLMNEGQIVFTTFHQSMSYEDFIEGIKPLKPEESDGFVKYDVVHGIFKRLCRKAETPPNISFDIAYKKLLTDLEEKDEIEVKNPKVSFKIKASENGEDLGVISNSYIKNITKEGLVYVSKSNRYAGTWGQYYKAFYQLLKDKYGYKESANTELKNHVIIIDEINRGNISQIFGELITLIEEDKRLGKDEALEVTLPYSKEKFGVPANLYIIGTMNTADRSVEALDTALRRRFSFVEMPPNSALIATDGKLKDKQGILNGIDLPLLLDTINKRIVKLLDKDHQIGHSYFMTVGNLDDLKIVFHNKIIPLLQEYFFGDYGKAGLVLGEEFFEPREEQNDNLFADFNGYDASEFAERPVYKVKDILNMPDSNFIKAINTLLRK